MEVSKGTWTSSWDAMGWVLYIVCVCAAILQPKHGLFLSGKKHSVQFARARPARSGIFAQIIAFPRGGPFNPSPALQARPPHPFTRLALPRRPSSPPPAHPPVPSCSPMAPIAVGDALPDGQLGWFDENDQLQQVSVHALASGKKVILFGVPGAFTPTCRSLRPFPCPVSSSHSLGDLRAFWPLCFGGRTVFLGLGWVGAEGGYMGSLGISSSPDSEWILAVLF